MTGQSYLDDVLPEACGLEIEPFEGFQKFLLSSQQYLALENLVKVDDPEEKRQVIAHNLRLVISIAKRYGDRGVELLDLVREGTMGLIHALENFELEGGFRFASYAAQCVRRNIEHAIKNNNELLSLPIIQGGPLLA